MRRWRRRGEDEENEDDTLTFDDLEDEEEDESPRKRRSYLPPRPIRTHFNEDSFDGEESIQERFDDLEASIRAGKYKPKDGDPWNAHVLYNLLKGLGEI